MKSVEELIKGYPGKGFTSTSVADAHKRGFELGIRIAAEEYRDGLEAMIDELDLSQSEIYRYDLLGFDPAELVRLMLAEKDRIISMLKAGMIDGKLSNKETKS